MNEFFVSSKCYPIGGGEADCELATYQGKYKFAQYFERAWTTVFFQSEYEALVFLRTLFPDRHLTVLEDTGKVVSTIGYESGITSMTIRKTKSF